jgi:hypothetical protein
VRAPPASDAIHHPLLPHMNQDSPSPPHSVPALLRELRDETTTLLRQEAELVKTELKENVSQTIAHAAKMGVGAMVAYAGLIVLLIGLGQLLGVLLVRAGLDHDIAQWLAPTLIGLLVAVVGYVMLAKAKNAAAHESIAPRQTIESVKTNAQWAQNKISQT